MKTHDEMVREWIEDPAFVRAYDSLGGCQAGAPARRTQDRAAAAGEVEAAGVNHLIAVVASVTFLGALARVKAVLAGLAGGPTLSVDLFNDHQFVLPTAGEPVKLSFPPQARGVSETAGA